MLLSVWEILFRIFRAWVYMVLPVFPACLFNMSNVVCEHYICTSRMGIMRKHKDYPMTIGVVMKSTKHLRREFYSQPWTTGEIRQLSKQSVWIFQHLGCLAMITVLLTHFFELKLCIHLQRCIDRMYICSVYIRKLQLYTVCCTCTCLKNLFRSKEI